MNTKKYFTNHEAVIVSKKKSAEDIINELKEHLSKSINSGTGVTYELILSRLNSYNPTEKTDTDVLKEDVIDKPSSYIDFYPEELLYTSNPDIYADNSYVRSALQNAMKGSYLHGNLTRTIGLTSNGQCTYGPSTFYLELGDLQGYFWDTNKPDTATDTKLTEKGFEKVWTGDYATVKNNEEGFRSAILQPGDLVITYGVKKDSDGSEKNSAHISMWTGLEFISDFKLKGMFVYDKERMDKNGKSVVVLRLDPNKVPTAKQGMKVEAKKSAKETDLIGDEDAFNKFLKSCPPNLLNANIINGREDYRMRRYWELSGKPASFWEGLDKGMFRFNKKDSKFHANTVAKNEETGEYEFMKYPDHESVHMETEWYKLGKVYPEDGEPFLLTPEHGEKYEEWQDFKNNYDLDESGEFFRYIPKNKILKDEQGAKIIIIEKEVVKEPEEEKDPLKCLLCQIMNAMGHRHHAFSELRPDKLTDIFGGDTEIVILLGGPEKAYDEDLFEEMLKDILPLVSTSKKYSKDDIKEIRSKKSEHGTSMKRLLSLMDDDKILKAFHGMLLFKTGGEIQFDAEGGLLNDMKSINIEIGEKEFSVYEAKTDEEKTKGLNGVSNLKEDEGMIFYWDEPQTVSMTMKDCDIPLLMCFFNEDLECVAIHQAQPHDKEPISVEDIQFVVELHPSADVKLGDELDFPGDDDEYVMLVLGSDGSIQMLLKGGERIFSRPNTKILLKWAKKAYSSDDPADYRRLGKLLFKYLDKQDNREPEYVQLDSKN